MSTKQWDLFCKVIDNYGDIGVCWRLARQLAHERGHRVRLWVDDLTSFQALCPEIRPHRSLQTVDSVEIRHWPHASSEFPANFQPADIIIEAFACELPENYLAAMAAKTQAPVWINLEYLSAETWIEDCHGLASPHPRWPLTKYFFFPGFTTRTGGLLREQDLIARRQAVQTCPADELQIFLFCYAPPQLPALLDAWSRHSQPVRLRLPPGPACQILAQHFQATLTQEQPPGLWLQHGQLSVEILPFVAQEHFDTYLWPSSINFVRGEDSLVRALWAAQPLIWQLYPQTECIHLKKLDAFLDRYGYALPQAAREALQNFSAAWNGAPHIHRPMAELWQDYHRHLPVFQQQARDFRALLLQQADLALQLEKFCEDKAKILL